MRTPTPADPAPAAQTPAAEPTAAGRIIGLEPKDAPVLRSVMQEAFAEYTTDGFSYGTEHETDESIRAELEGSGRAAALVVDGAVAAVVKFHVEPETGLLYFWRLSVRPQHRGKGLATQIVRWLFDVAAAEGLGGIACNVVPRHAQLARLYEHSSMHIVGEVEHVTPRGQTLTLLRLEGALPPTRAIIELREQDAPLLRAALHES